MAKAKPSKKQLSKLSAKGPSKGSKSSGVAKSSASKGGKGAKAPAKVASKPVKAPGKSSVKGVKKQVAKGPAKGAAKAVSKAVSKASAKVAGMSASGKAGAKAAEPKVVEAAKPVVAAVPVVDDKNKPKGITVVDNKPGSGRKPPKPKKVVEMPQLGPPLLGGGRKWKPLILSGPNAPKAASKDIDPESLKGKSPLSKKDLDHYRSLLLKKRGELVGDVSTMESAALNDGSGSLSNTPQHVAEQGSEAYEQSLSLGIAEVDRQLIREIDEALKRVVDGSFGLCQKTGKPISKERLDELPWTRLSIEAAREHEKRTFFPRGSSSDGARSAAASGD